MWFCWTIVYAMYSQWYSVQIWAFYQVIVGFFPLTLMVSLYEMSESNLSRARNSFPPRSVLIKIVNLWGCQAYQVCSFILVTSCNMDLCCDEPYRETQGKKMYSLKEDPCAFRGSVIFVSVHIFPTFITKSVLHSGITQLKPQFPLSHCTWELWQSGKLRYKEGTFCNPAEFTFTTLVIIKAWYSKLHRQLMKHSSGLLKY